MDQLTHGPQAILANAMIGLLSPLDSLRFMRSKKTLLVMGLAPYLVATTLYGVLVGRVALPMLKVFLIEKNLLPDTMEFAQVILSALIWLLSIMIFALLGPAIINTIASPLYDHIAAQTYESCGKAKMPRQGFEQFFRSFIGECSKLVLWVTFTVILAATPFAAFLGGPLALWFMGWTHIDRTLNLKSMHLKERLVFGLNNAPACVALGLWALIPGINAIFVFLMASAGAVVVAKAEQRAN
jgi:uncharacterized protein involved in cysteine biosynthesis